MRPLVIVNPRSGGGRTGTTYKAMHDVIERSLGTIDVAITEAPRHALELAKNAALEGREIVIAVGGDGSIHEVANGLLEAAEQGKKGTKLGVIGQGTGGDFRRTLGIEHRLDHYCKAIADGKTRACDVGKASFTGNDGAPMHSYFVNILSVGMGGLVDRYVADMSSKMGGTAAYFLASLRALVGGEIGVVRATITLDGEEREELIESRLLAVCNGRFFGSGMQVAPMARVDDGTFEVIDLGAASIPRFAWVNTRIYDGSHLKQDGVRHFRCQSISLRLENKGVSDKFLLDVDGEPLGQLPLTISVVPSALEVFAPA